VYHTWWDNGTICATTKVFYIIEPHHQPEKRNLASSVKPVEVPVQDQVSAVMSTKVITAKANERVIEVLHAMVRHKIGSIVVVEKGKPLGILTERDITTMVAKGRNLRTVTVKNAMSKPLITIAPSEEIWKAVEEMVRNDIRKLPVIDNDKLVGMVTDRDIMYWLVKIEYEPNMPEDLKKLFEKRARAHALLRTPAVGAH
jgi:CBS domain-containing protein